jgi:hypothetical protein
LRKYHFARYDCIANQLAYPNHLRIVPDVSALLSLSRNNSPLGVLSMSEREVVKSILDFSFIIKAQLHSDQAALLRSILSIAIMEAEDLLEAIDENAAAAARPPKRAARG